MPARLCFLVLALLVVREGSAFSSGSLNCYNNVLQHSSRSSSRHVSPMALKMSVQPEGDTRVDRRAAVAGLFTLLVTSPLAFPSDADAARSGGRVSSGGIRSRSSAGSGMKAGGGGVRIMSAPRAAPAAPSVTIIQRTPIIQAVPSYGGFGFGYGAPSYGGFGFGLSPGAWLGLTALELAESVAREQRRAAYLNQQLETQRQLGKDQAEIQALQKQIEEQNQKLNAMQAALNQKKADDVK